MKQQFRKSFTKAQTAQFEARSLRMMPREDAAGMIDVSVTFHSGEHWVYIGIDGNYEPDEFFTATGYRLVNE